MQEPKAADSKPSSNYTPAVGDVVEFERNGKKMQGVLFLNYGTNLGIIFPCEGDFLGLGWVRLSNYPKAKKVGFAPMMLEEYGKGDNGSVNSCKKRIKAYFAQPTFTGTYEERQAQWVEHHGLKVGSKVKVVRKFENQESGSAASSWDAIKEKAVMQGKIFPLSGVFSEYVMLKAGICFPYFALEPVK